VYGNRRYICRLFGATDDMPCPHGCGPEKRLTHAETEALNTGLFRDVCGRMNARAEARATF